MGLARQVPSVKHLSKLGCVAVAVVAADQPYTADMQALLAQQNLHRCMHGMPPLQWNSTLALGAQEWADAGKLESSDEAVGENLLVGPHVSGVQATEHWYNEVLQTNNGIENQFSPKTGHYTQMTWKSTTQIGCGKAKASTNTFWVCRYFPEGNLPGKFSDNVGPMLDSANCARSEDTSENIKWAFGATENKCAEAGALKVKRIGNSLINVLGYGVEEYEVAGFSVTHSGAGLPLGSTKDGTYSFTRQNSNADGDKTFMQVSVVTQEMKFSGPSAALDGKLWVKTTSGGDVVVKLGRAQGESKNGCADDFYFISDASIVRKFQVLGLPMLMGKFEVGGLAVHLPVGHSLRLLAVLAVAAAGLLVRRVVGRRTRHAAAEYQGVDKDLQMSIVA